MFYGVKQRRAPHAILQKCITDCALMTNWKFVISSSYIIHKNNIIF